VFTHDRPSYLTAVDENKIEKIIDNLISNAVKYSFEQSQVHIDLKCEDSKWTLLVKDHGIGISRKAQLMLFREFHRGENAVNLKVVGSGIGLLLVKNYVRMHSGKISCQSQENAGSTFKIVIPHKEISTQPQQSLNSYPNSHSDQIDHTDVLLPQYIEEETCNPKDLKVLVVEDNDDLRNFIRSALSREFDVFVSEDGAKAWEFILKQMPDLVVSDIIMPNLDGFELCEKVKSTYETSHIPIILLTGLSDKTEQMYGLGLGADDYLTKPFDITLLEQRIKTIIRNREAVREKAMKLIKGNKDEPLLANELNDKFVREILNVARANISNSEFNKDIFALALNMSPSLLYKKIKSLTNQSPTDFIKIVRLDHALELLQSRKYTVTEVSELCGFTSVGYFSTVFKKHFGKSPTGLFE